MSLKDNVCPKCGKPLTLIETEGIKVLECLCGYRADPSDDWLTNPALLGLFEEAMTAPGSAKPLVGESDNAIQLFLILVGKGSAEVRGLTAAGKNTLADHVLTVFPRKSWLKVGGLTDKSLRYLADNVKILYVTERRGIKGGDPSSESTAEYDVKVGISEGEISVATTEKDPETHEFKTTFRKVTIDSFLFTTTEVDSPPELENRLNILNVHDDIAQNTLVRDMQLRNAQSFSWEKPDYTQRRTLAARALDRVMAEAPTDVIIPYADILKPILSVESSVVRRNTPKILDLIGSCARLYYRQRQIVEGPHGRGIIASPEDLALVLYTGERSLAAVLSAIPEKVALVLEICKVLATAKVDITTENILLNTGEAKARLGSLRTIQRCVRALSDRGILVEEGKEGRNKIYTLQDGSNPLVIDIAALLRAAWAVHDAYTPLVSSVAEQTEAEMGDTERQTPNLSDSRPLSPNSSSVDSTTDDTEGIEGP